MRSPRWSVVVALAAILAVAALGGCSVLDPDDGQRGELESARERWQREGPGAYRTTQTHVCFCGTEVRGPVMLRVTASGTTRTYVADGRAVPSDLVKFFPTVEGLFDEIESALDEGADQVRVTYDPTTGAPLDVFIDYSERTADEEQGWTLTLPERI
jgi:uncharacterized protein DUF6174